MVLEAAAGSLINDWIPRRVVKKWRTVPLNELHGLQGVGRENRHHLFREDSQDKVSSIRLDGLGLRMEERREAMRQMPSILKLRRALALIILMVGRCAFALSPDVAINDLRHTIFHPPSAPQSMVQTRDHYLWIATLDGVYRFDGLRFEHIELARSQGLSSTQPLSLFAPSSGGLWIGLLYGGALFLKDGHITGYSEADGLPGGSVKAFAETDDGTVWLAATGGLARLEGNRWGIVGEHEKFTGKQARSLLVDSAGTLWVDTSSGVSFLKKGEPLFQLAAIVPGKNSGDALNLAETPSGAVWILAADGWRLLSAGSTPQRQSTASKLSRLLFDREGTLWIIDEKGHQLRKIRYPDRIKAGGMDHFAEESDRSSGETRFEIGSNPHGVLEDQEGNLWLLDDTKLHRFSERNVFEFLPTPVRDTPDQPWPETAPVASEEGSIWLVSVLPSRSLLHAGKVTEEYPKLAGISAGFRSENGTVWLGGSEAIWKSTGDSFERIELPSGTENFAVQAIAEDSNGSLWISVVRKGVFKRVSGVWLPYGGLDQLPKLTAISLATDRLGRVWFGYTEGRLAMVDGEHVTTFSGPRSSAIGNVKAISGRGDDIWAGGEFGVALLIGDRFQLMNPDGEGRFSNITGIIQTSNGDLWLNSQPGIVHVTTNEIKRAKTQMTSRLASEVFDSTDGVHGGSERLRPIPTAVQGTDDRLWFVRDTGLYTISPNRIVQNKAPPHLIIQALSSGEVTYLPQDVLQLPPKTTSIRIDYVGLNLTSPEKVRYRYRLEGVDQGWQDGQDRRQAFYTSVSPGKHHFEVIASNGDGLWSAPVSLSFVVPPTFMQSRWFVALWVLAAGAMAWMLIRLRVRQISLRMRVRLNERERIARELHDTLLQSTQALILAVQAAADRVRRGQTAPAYAMLDEALTRADDLMAAGRDRIQDLRLPVGSEEDLEKAFVELGRELSSLYGMSFDVSADGPSRTLAPLIREEIYGIGREAMVNGCRHSRGNKIEVRIIYATDEFCLKVLDNGTGLNPTSAKTGVFPGHWGLTGMRERASQIGAQFSILSRVPSGTEIELRVPARVAYPRKLIIWKWFRRREPCRG